ncbi:MAG: peptidoglycan-binding domain-containing protein [Pyrinomonadaceae bacterium]
MPKQKVGESESTSSIAKKNGFFWRTIWEHPENAELRRKRADPNVLFADDDIFIPEKQLKEVSKGTEQEHVFKLKGEPAKIKIRLMKLGKPRANESYVMEIDNNVIDGKTDDDGRIEHFIPPDATGGRLILQGGKEIYPLNFGSLDPIDTISGVQQRLNNLGYSCGGEMGEMGEDTKQALGDFQNDYKLEATCKIDDATKAKLSKLAK